MKITDAIMQLEHIRKQHGDMELVLFDSAKEYQIADFGAAWKPKENDVTLLKERRAALIAAAVTGKIAVPNRAASVRNGRVHEN
jgi:hypothetical protein